MVDTKELLRSVDLASLLTQLCGEPIGAGNRRRWHCMAPEHVDDHPSVSMRVGADGIERWKCWSDGRSGTAIDAIMARYNTDVADAIKQLHQRHPHLTPTPRPSRRPAKQPARTPTPRMLNWISSSQDRLWSPQGTAALAWLRARGLSDVVIQANQLGFNATGPHPTLIKIGLPGGEGVTIPAFNAANEIISAQLRLLHSTSRAKYLMPAAPQATMPAVSFPRGGTGDVLVVTEGIFDAIAANQAGFRGAALSSTSVNMDAAAATIAATNPRQVVIALDGDPAGQRATVGLRNALASHQICPAVLKVPDGEDLNSLHRKNNQRCNTNAKSALRSIR